MNEALQKVLASFSHLTVLEELLSSINESISCVITNREHILYANDLFCQVVGYDAAEIVGKELVFLYEHLDKKMFFQEVSPTILSGRIWRGEMQKRTADGQLFWGNSTIVPVVNEVGEAELFLFQSEVAGEKNAHSDIHFKTNFIHTFKSLQNGIFKVRKKPDNSLVYTMSEGKLMDAIGASSREIYKSKEFVRNMYQVYEHSMKSKSYQAFMMERDLRKAIHHDEFVAYFQPKIDARTNKIIGAEALIRWNHPTQGLIPPAQFIPIAEESGLITQIEKWMKRTVCKQLVMWRNAGKRLIPISVNISSNRFLQKDFALEIRELLQEFQLDGQWLEFEITENSIMRNEDTVQKTLRELKEMGVRIFIDDFGTGYSSFNYLKTFELDGVKIDRSFIRNIAQQPVNASITSAMIKMAQHLKLEVIAEGVETEDELAHLHDEGCYMIQGFYYSKPQPIEQFEQRYIVD